MSVILVPRRRVLAVNHGRDVFSTCSASRPCVQSWAVAVANQPKPTRRRTGSLDSKTRATLIDVTERLMLREGYAAVTSRRVAVEAEVTAPLVHYYFPTLDDLFVAVLRRRAEQQLTRQARLLAADEPLRALWSFNTDRKSARFLTEFIG